MRPRYCLPALGLALLLFPGLLARAQSGTEGHTIMVAAFENRSSAPGLDWIGEAFSEVLGQRMARPGSLVIGRRERIYAFERLGIPTGLQLTRATMLRVAQEMDLDYVVLGTYRFDGQTFSAEARVLDVSQLKLSPPASASGPLQQLITIQYSLAWDLLRHLDPELATSRSAFIAESPTVRLDAFENYIRGVLATEAPERIRYFREAVRINPNFSQALLQLGKTQFEAREYAAAAQSLAAVAPDSPLAGEANFFLGLSALYLAQFERAEKAFAAVAERVPLSEVVNNLGVSLARRGKPAVEQFQRAVQNAPRDPDYKFNLAVALYRSGDASGAARQLRESLALRPDPEAKAFLDAVMAGTVSVFSTPSNTPPGSMRLPLTRIKRNYDETSFLQIAMEMQKAREMRLKDLPPAEHAAAHVEQGRRFLQQNLLEQAEREFREAIVLDPTQAESHLGLAEVLARRKDDAGARAEAQAALRLQPSPAAYVLAARLELRDNRPADAAASVQRALALDPANPAALELQRTIAAQLAGKGQPLQTP